MPRRRHIAALVAAILVPTTLATPSTASDTFEFSGEIQAMHNGFYEGAEGVPEAHITAYVTQFVPRNLGMGIALVRDEAVIDPSDGTALCYEPALDHYYENRGYLDCTFRDSAVGATYAVVLYDTHRVEEFDGSHAAVMAAEVARSEDFQVEFDLDLYEEDQLIRKVPYEAAYAACTPFVFTPQVEPDFDTLPSAYKACEGVVRSGGTMRQVAQAVRGFLTVAEWNRWKCEIAGLSCEPEPGEDPSPGPDDDPDAPPADPTDPPISPGGAPTIDWGTPLPNRPLWQILLLRQPSLTEQSARQIADQCEELESNALANGVHLELWWEDESSCASLPIYVPGGDIKESTQHRLEAIIANPARFQNNYLRAEIRQVTLSRSWFSGFPCPNAPLLDASQPTSCDEFPNYATNQSGPGASLRRMESSENSMEGSRFSGFIAACQLRSGSSAENFGDAFLTVPVPGLVTTTRVCGRNMGFMADIGAT